MALLSLSQNLYLHHLHYHFYQYLENLNLNWTKVRLKNIFLYAKHPQFFLQSNLCFLSSNTDKHTYFVLFWTWRFLTHSVSLESSADLQYWVLEAAFQRWQSMPLQWAPAKKDIPSPSLSEEIMFMSCCSLLHRKVVDVRPCPWSVKSWAQRLAQPPEWWLKEILLLSLGVESEDLHKIKLLGYADFLKMFLHHLPLQFPGFMYRFRFRVSVHCQGDSEDSISTGNFWLRLKRYAHS